MRRTLAETGGLGYPGTRRMDRMHRVKANRRQPGKRRSVRIPLSARIALSGHDRERRAFTMTSTATNLNRFGGAIQLPRELSIGCTVVVRNGRGVQAPARVATQSAVQGIYTYGIEFLEGDSVTDFWGITFPTQT